MGIVRDKDGKPIPGATVTMSSGDRNRTVTTRDDGHYSIGMTHAPSTGVPFTIKAEKQGYKPFERHLKSNHQHQRPLDIPLEVQNSISSKGSRCLGVIASQQGK
jgi:carboxypeptidase family protein